MKNLICSVLGGLSLSLVSTLASAAFTSDGSYRLDKSHTHIGFSVTHLGISKTQGRFNEFQGNFDLVAGGDSSVSFTIDAKSVDTNSQKRDEHLRSDDFFDVEEYETITFQSTSVNYTASGDPLKITGDLSLHGTTLPVTFDVETVGAGKGPKGKQRAGYTAKTKIQRSSFGMNEFPAVVGDEVTITVNLEIIQK